MSSLRSCLVVGAGGFLGAHVCEALQDKYILIQASSNMALATRLGWLHLDVTRPSTLCALPTRVDSVVFLAQSPHYRNFPARAAHIWDVNVQGALGLLEYARNAGARHFVLASSGSVYAPSLADLREESPLHGGVSASFYVRSKMAAELLLRAYSPFMSTICLRFFTMYGPGLGQGMLLARMANAVARGEGITLSGEYGFAFNPLHVSDAARAVEAALRLKGDHTINVAGPHTLTLGKACHIMGSALGRIPHFIHEGQSWRMVADIGRMTALLGEPTVGAADGLARYAIHACNETTLASQTRKERL